MFTAITKYLKKLMEGKQTLNIALIIDEGPQYRSLKLFYQDLCSCPMEYATFFTVVFLHLFLEFLTLFYDQSCQPGNAFHDATF